MFWSCRNERARLRREVVLLAQARNEWCDEYTRVRDENEALRKSLKELADLTKHFVEML